jgi:hypothetical protein
MKYQVVKNAVDSSFAKFIASTLLIAESKGDFQVDTQQVKDAMIVHGYPLLDTLLLKMLPTMQQQTGLELLPTYSFARVYRKGQDLKKHTDRPACEISATLTLGYIADNVWPIYADQSGPIELDVGDMLIYRGCEVEHWREAFDGGVWVQVFLHYIDVNGPYKDHAFDKRNVGEFYETLFAEFLK